MSYTKNFQLPKSPVTEISSYQNVCYQTVHYQSVLYQNVWIPIAPTSQIGKRRNTL